jgi:hypothetical protein
MKYEGFEGLHAIKLILLKFFIRVFQAFFEGFMYLNDWFGSSRSWSSW